MPSNFELTQTSVEYDDLNVTSFPHGPVSYSAIDLLPGIPHIDQLEVERLFDTGAKTGATLFTIADRRRMFKLPKNWYTINETNKTISISEFSLIADANTTFNLTTGLGRKYISLSDANTFITIPNLGSNDTIIIRRKTLSEEKLVNFTAGSRLTSGQLNLTSNQLINILQELLWKVDKEVIIKYDKDAIDGPFLGSVDGSFLDILGNIDMNGRRVTNLGESGTLEDAMPKKEISDVVFKHGVITKDTAPVSTPGSEFDVIGGTPDEGRSGVWFNPQDGKLRAWAGDAWVIVTNAINPAVNPFLVQTNTAQSISGQKTFTAPTTFDSTVTMTNNLAVTGNITTSGSLSSSSVLYTPSGAGAVARSASSKFGETVSVKDFGAVGDGVADDTAAIQAAITASANKSVYFPSGTYVATTLTVANPCRLFGEGIIKKTTAAQSALLTLATNDVDIDGLEFRGFSFDATPASVVFLNTAIKIYGSSSVSPYRRFNITNVKINGFAGFGMDIRWSEDVTITNCQIRYCGYAGILFDSIVRGVIANNRISFIDTGTGTNAYGISLSRDPTKTLVNSVPTEHVTVIGNVVTDVPKWSGIDGHAPHNCNIVGNIVARCKNGIYAQYDSTVYSYPSPARFVRIADNVVIGRSTTAENEFGIASIGSPSVGWNEHIVLENNSIINAGSMDGGNAALTLTHSRYSVAKNNVVYKGIGAGLSMRTSCDQCIMEGNLVDGLIRPGASSAQFAKVGEDNTNCSFVANRFRNTTGSASFNCQIGIYYVSANSGTVYVRNRIDSNAIDVVGAYKRFIASNAAPIEYTDLKWQLERESCPPFTHTATGGAPRESTASQSSNFRRTPAVGLAAGTTIRRARVSYRSTDTTYQIAVRPNEGGDPYVVGVYTVDGTNIAALASIPDITIDIEGIYWDD